MKILHVCHPVAATPALKVSSDDDGMGLLKVLDLCPIGDGFEHDYSTTRLVQLAHQVGAASDTPVRLDDLQGTLVTNVLSSWHVRLNT